MVESIHKRRQKRRPVKDLSWRSISRSGPLIGGGAVMLLCAIAWCALFFGAGKVEYSLIAVMILTTIIMLVDLIPRFGARKGG